MTVKKITLCVFLVLCFVSWAIVSYAQETSPDEFLKQHPAILSLEGLVKNIDGATSTMTVASDAGDVTFLVPVHTIIFRGSEKIDLSGVVADDLVLIKYYKDSGGDAVVLSITIDIKE